jgi:hypothetical protein
MAAPLSTAESDVIATTDEITVLHHYTSADGLKGIVESRQLHATNLRFLNDAAEFIWYTRHRFKHIISKCGPSIAKEWGQEWSQQWTDTYSELMIHHFKQRAFMYGVSFCPPHVQGDTNGLLSQWRGYGADGGYAIAFDIATLAARIEQEKLKAKEKYAYLGLAHIKYFDLDSSGEPSAEAPSLNEEDAIRYFLEARYKEQFEGVVDNELYGQSLYTLAYLSAISKHPGFSEEREVRLVCRIIESRDQTPKKTIQFRNKNGLLVPFVRVFDSCEEDAGAPLPITQVIIGPHRNSEQRMRSVELLLKQNGIKADVVCSKIPYTGM